MFTSAMIDRLTIWVDAMLGTPWVDDSFDPTVGLDCWSFIWLAYTTVLEVPLPRNLWAAKGLFVPVSPHYQPLDVLHFWPPSAPREHLGVKLRGRLFADCNWGGKGVALHDLTREPWANALKGAWRLAPDWRERLEGVPCA